MTPDEKVMQGIKIALAVIFMYLFARWSQEVIFWLQIISNGK